MPFFSSKELLLASHKGPVPDDAFRIGKHYELPAYVSFSGGRTSGYMLYQILHAYKNSLPKDLFILFCNTGQEAEETLEFVRDCQTRWKAPIVWLEYKRDKSKPLILPGTEHHKFPKIGCHGWKEVDFDTASRNGEPFESIIDVKIEWRLAIRDEDPILPNVAGRWCSGELKASTMDRWMWAHGYDVFTAVVGLRADEPSRVQKMRNNSTQFKEFALPLADAIITEEEVLDFWKRQPFDLKLKVDPILGTYEGNCVFCFLKNSRKIARLVKERPESLDWWARMEEKTHATFARNRPTYSQLKNEEDARTALKMCDDEDSASCACTD